MDVLNSTSSNNLYGPPLPKSSKNYFQEYHQMDLYIKSIESNLEGLRKELATLIRKTGPKNVQGVSYDQIPGCAGVIVPDMQILNRILDLRMAISIGKSNLATWSEMLSDLKRTLTKKSKQLNNLNLKVFVLSWIDGKNNHEIAQELGYSVGRIWNIKVEINKELLTS